MPGAPGDGIVAVVTTTAISSGETVGMLVMRWRERRRRSQLDVSLAADLSAKHLSYIETGRSSPSPEMIERIRDELDVPLRERIATTITPRTPARTMFAATGVPTRESPVMVFRRIGKEAVQGDCDDGFAPKPSGLISRMNRAKEGIVRKIPARPCAISRGVSVR
ncbi:helix-turn-helix domain-containing protein [Kribbella sp. NBC_00889]|uniref:helix-turn-helix domain-containing protein n=1 Tax=Kribbella sp. NBC_00889 TaxID=2975974 RepID=UPI00386DB37A|nr:helix-turn-helix domain-containing protein [Kribbella sp. NBC_00889]